MKKILYVEDDMINALIVRKLLQPEFTIEHVTDGESCIQKLEKESFDLVLMDINLGCNKMDGIDTFRKIRLIQQFKSLPVFAVTSYAMPEDRNRFLKEGFDEYVAKPIERLSLINCIQNFLESRSNSIS